MLYCGLNGPPKKRSQFYKYRDPFFKRPTQTDKKRSEWAASDFRLIRALIGLYRKQPTQTGFYRSEWAVLNSILVKLLSAQSRRRPAQTGFYWSEWAF